MSEPSLSVSICAICGKRFVGLVSAGADPGLQCMADVASRGTVGNRIDVRADCVSELGRPLGGQLHL